jgi:DNA-binding CsgD family transcriptional regulator
MEAVSTALPTVTITSSGQEWEHLASSLGLSPQQARIVELILQGKPDKQIARQIGVSFGTLRAHLSRAFERTGVSGRMELAALVFSRAAATRHQKVGQQQ